MIHLQYASVCLQVMYGLNQARARRAYGGNYGLGGLASSLYTAYRNFRGPIRDGQRLQRALLGAPTSRGRVGGRSRVSKVSFKKRSSKFRKFRAQRRKKLKGRKKKKSTTPAWARGELGRYLSRAVVIRDSGTFNMNYMGDTLQNRQTYWMDWCASAVDLDNWMVNAYNAASATTVPDNAAIRVTRLFKTFAIVNNCNQPVDVDVWSIRPRRGYNEAYANVSGVNPASITDVLAETKTTTLQYNDYGHDPKMSARLTTWFKLGKRVHRRLQPGDTMRFSLMGSPKTWAKILCGIQTSGYFAQDHTLFSALSKTGCLIRARGTVIHDHSQVPNFATGGSLQATDLRVAQSGFNLDCKWDRQCWYKVPMPGLTTLSHPYGLYSGADNRANNTMTLANESRWADATHAEYKTNA